MKTVSEPVVFTWIVPPTVIYGRHQDRQQEVNEAYCAAHGVQVVQRQSGGGCVYADNGNLMVSFVSLSASAMWAPFSNALRRAATIGISGGDHGA